MSDNPTVQDRKILHDSFFNETWFKERPELIKKAFLKNPPFNTYRIKSTGQFGFIICIDEPESERDPIEYRLAIPEDWNHHKFDSVMFGDKIVFGFKEKDFVNLGICEPWNESTG